MKLDAIKLSKDDYEYIINYKKKIGAGEDGTVYYIEKGVAYKFYHDSIEKNVLSSYDRFNQNNRVLDDDGVNTAKYITISSSKYTNLRYIDSNGIRLIRKDGLERAIERQKDIHQTILPQNIIYVNGHFAGCKIKYFNTNYGIYKAHRLPKILKLKVIKALLLKYKELIDHNIYPVDLAQRDKYNPGKRINSNILLGHNFEPIIIDLDGKSTIYTEKDNQNYLNAANANFSRLIIELITNIDLNENMADEDVEIIINELIESGINEELVQKFIDWNFLSIDDTERIITDFSRSLRK